MKRKRCSRCTKQSTVTVFTRLFGREEVCGGCRIALWKDGQVQAVGDGLDGIAAEIAECGADLLQYTERLFPQAGAIGVQYLPAAYPSNRRFELR